MPRSAHAKAQLRVIAPAAPVARFDVDGLPRLVQIQADGFLHNGPFH
jgi:hypothetical protein